MDAGRLSLVGPLDPQKRLSVRGSMNSARNSSAPKENTFHDGLMSTAIENTDSKPKPAKTDQKKVVKGKAVTSEEQTEDKTVYFKSWSGDKL